MVNWDFTLGKGYGAGGRAESNLPVPQGWQAGLGLGGISATLEEETACAGSTLPACEVMDLYMIPGSVTSPPPNL